jgi:histone acetyltransferase MYST1
MSGSTSQYSITLPLSDLAKACHLRVDDVASTLSQLGFLCHRRPLPALAILETEPEQALEDEEDEDAKPAMSDNDEWSNTEIVISREHVDREWAKWKVRPMGVLDESCVLL